MVLANANDELLLLTQRGNIKKLKVKDIALSSRNKKDHLESRRLNQTHIILLIVLKLNRIKRFILKQRQRK